MNCKTNADIVFYFFFALSACLFESKYFLKATDTSTNNKNENLKDMPCKVLLEFYDTAKLKPQERHVTTTHYIIRLYPFTTGSFIHPKILFDNFYLRHNRPFCHKSLSENELFCLKNVSLYETVYARWQRRPFTRVNFNSYLQVCRETRDKS